MKAADMVVVQSVKALPLAQRVSWAIGELGINPSEHARQVARMHLRQLQRVEDLSPADQLLVQQIISATLRQA